MTELIGWGRRLWARNKVADEAVSSDTALSNDDTLNFPVKASTVYRFRFRVFYDTPTTADFKYDINGPAAPTLVQIAEQSIAPGATAYSGISIRTAFAFGPTVITETSGTNGFIAIDGVVQNVTAGTIAFRWAQNSSVASATTVRAGSYVEWSELS